MYSDPDSTIDRRRLKRRLNFWRIFGVVAVVAGLAAAVGRFGGNGFTDYVARVEIDGLILSDRELENEILHVADAERAKALVVYIDSPGGTVVGGESLYQALRTVAARKPVVAVMGNTATSAAYMVALGADRIFAHAGTVTGSVGVILQTADVTGLMDKLGIKPETVKSGELKAQPNPLETFSPTARARLAAVVDDLHAMFLDMVKDRRRMPAGKAAEVGDGRVFSGRQAMDAGLVDAIGRERDARTWLSDAHDISVGMETRDIGVSEPEDIWRGLISGLIGKVLFSERVRLDGMISLWHPGMQ